MKFAAAFALAFGSAACVSGSAPGRGAEWGATGWLDPDRRGEGEVIGVFDTRAACEAAVDAWMARQVVGNPVSGACLPVDRR